MSTPQLGYGERGEAPINAVNQYMRAAPWYQALLRSFGQDPNNVHLNDAQKQQVIRAAQANGIVVDEGHNGQEVDDSGNFRAKGHALRNTLIVAGIAGAALATMGAAGVFAGGAGAGAGAGSGAAAAGAGTTAAAGSGAAAAGGATLAATGASSIPWGTIISAGTGLFGNLFAAHEAAAGADKSAELQSAAAKYSADLTAKANADALAFQRSLAENAFQNNEAARQGNYNMDAARQRRLGFIGEEVGLGPREIPAYVPGVDPNLTGGTLGAAMGGASGASGPLPSIDPAKGDIAGQVSAYFKSRGVPDTETPYWVQKWSEFGAKDPAYFNQRLAQADIFGGGAATGARTAGPAPAPATTATPFMPATIRPGLQPIGFYA